MQTYIHDTAQNENVNRPLTSQRRVKDLRRPDRHTQMKVLEEKTYNFVEYLWAMYIDKNSTNLQYVMATCITTYMYTYLHKVQNY